MDDEEFRLLARIERGQGVFRPTESTPEARQLFQMTWLVSSNSASAGGSGFRRVGSARVLMAAT
jgi:hypothetical protein